MGKNKKNNLEERLIIFQVSSGISSAQYYGEALAAESKNDFIHKFYEEYRNY